MEIDYKLKILGENVEFSPRKEIIQPLTTSDKNIFELTAGNGFGKTFILNLLAYAFYADKLKDEAILKTLKERVADYGNTNAYELQYRLSFNLPDGKKLYLTKEIGKDRIVQFDNEAPVGVSYLHNVVSILYDVPVDPSLRLNEVIKDLGEWNNRLKKKFSILYNSLDKIESQFNNVRDDSKIVFYENKAKEYKIEIDNNSKLISEKESLSTILNLFSELDKLVLEQKRLKNLSRELTQKEKDFKNSPKPKKLDKKDENLIKSLQQELGVVKSQFKLSMLGLIESISNKNELVDYLTNHSSLNRTFSFIKENDIDTLITRVKDINEIDYFNGQLQFLIEGIINFVDREERGKKYVIYNFLQQLLEQIDELIENGADGILEVLTKNDTNIFKREIENRIIENRVVDYSEIKSLVKVLPNSIKDYISRLKKISANIENESKKKGVDSDGEKYYKLKAEIDDLKQRVEKTQKFVDRSKIILSENLGISDLQLASFDETISIREKLKSRLPNERVLENLTDSLHNIAREKQRLIQLLEEIKKSAALNEAMLINERKKNISIYNEVSQKKIRKFIKTLQIIIRNIGVFNELIENINDGNLHKFQEEEDLKFINVAGKIIAHSMDNKILRSDGNYIRLEYFDLITKEFHCEGDITIRKDDISTGLASANYLRQRIENIEGKYVVILLDEIGNMAKDTLGEVINSIKKIETQKRLIISILTQPSSDKNEILIKPY
jgi:hypothetical protein